MRPVKWEVDEETTVTILCDGDGRDSIMVEQGDDNIELTTTGASAAGLVQALMAAMVAVGWDFPDLDEYLTPATSTKG